jgi:hypothetical protein
VPKGAQFAQQPCLNLSLVLILLGAFVGYGSFCLFGYDFGSEKNRLVSRLHLSQQQVSIDRLSSIVSAFVFVLFVEF